MNNIFKLIFIQFGLKGFSALYSVIVFVYGISLLSIEEYGEVMVNVASFALFARIVSWGFDYRVKDFISQYSVKLVDVVVSKLVLACIANAGLVLLLLLNGMEQYVIVSILGIVCYSFESMAYHQAKEMQGSAVIPVLLGMSLALLSLVLIATLHEVTVQLYFSICVLGPLLGWVYISVSGIKKERCYPRFRSFSVIIKSGFQMFSVIQIGGLYTSVLPILVGTQSLAYVAMYSIMLRVSNFAKSFGLVVNQVFFYNSLIKNDRLNFYMALFGSVTLAALAGLLIFEFFDAKVSSVFSSELVFIIWVVLFVAVGSVANFLIVRVFFSTMQYLNYRNVAFFIITIPLLSYWLLDLPPEYVLFFHVGIELGLIAYAIYYHKSGGCKNGTG